ncbi:MAG: TonB-dependent receptor [Saprospiraceae bacterium]
MRIIITIIFLQLPLVLLLAQQDTISDSVLKELMVKSSWANDQNPVTHKNISKEELNRNDFAQDMPYLLQLTPSVVVTSDAGTGIGYTGIRIRGTDPTRINVTINGIPFNDAESQSVYWVNIYDIAGSTDQVQIQRGVGSSTNGAGAFGATINLNTNHLHEKAYGEAVATLSSFATRRRSVRWGTGRLKGGFNFEGRWSHATSAGYMDRARANLLSSEITASWLLKNASLRFNLFSGSEITYQSWNGVPAQYLQSNRTYNSSGTEKQGEPYDNQIDNYFQKNFQLLYNQQINNKWSSSLALHLTRGFGYFEEYKAAQHYKNYGLPNIVFSNDTLKETDLIRRRWLDNWFYGGVYGFEYRGSKINLTIGGGLNHYTGRHFGEIIWAQNLPVGVQSGHKWYDNTADKTDFNTYVKATYQFSDRISGYADMQVRALHYEFIGKDRNAKDLEQAVNLIFFNPKLGLNYRINDKLSAYSFFGVANREPNRQDFVNSSIVSRPKPEHMNNLEIGVKGGEKKLNYSANFYLMSYRNELVLTGLLNDVGDFTRVNVPRSYRAGIELDASYSFWKKFALAANLTLSQNKVKEFSEYVDNWDTGLQDKIVHKNTNLLFSPNVIGAAQFSYNFFEKNNRKASIELRSKLVGKQYIDNTSDETAALNSYVQHDLVLNFITTKRKFGDVDFSLVMFNALNNNVISNAWVYRYSTASNPINGDIYSVNGRSNNVYNQIGYFPQAFRNFSMTMRLRFD